MKNSYLILLLVAQTFSISEASNSDIILALKFSGAAADWKYSYQKLDNFQDGVSIDPTFSLKGGFIPSLQFDLRVKKFMFYGSACTSKYSPFTSSIRDKTGNLRYLYDTSDPRYPVKSGIAAQLSGYTQMISYSLAWQVKPSVVGGVTFRQSVARFRNFQQVNGSFTDSLQLDFSSKLSAAGVVMRYEKKLYPFTLKSKLQFYPYIRFEITPPGVQRLLSRPQFYIGNGAQFHITTEWKLLFISYQYEFNKSRKSTIQDKTHSIHIGIGFHLLNLNIE